MEKIIFNSICFISFTFLIGFVFYQIRLWHNKIMQIDQEERLLKKRQEHELKIIDKQTIKQKAENDFKKDILFPHEEKMKKMEKEFTLDGCIDIINKVKNNV